jgi:hypothetical protein
MLDAGAFALPHATAPKATPVQDADRADVVHRDMGVQRPDRHLVHDPGERLRRDAGGPNPLRSSSGDVPDQSAA